MENKEVIKEKRIDILNMWKKFWNPEPQEITVEEEILNNASVSQEDKKELLKALKNTEKLSNTLFRDSYKTTKLNVKHQNKLAQNEVNKMQNNMINKNENKHVEKELGE